MSEISSLQTGLSALLAMKRGLDITGHNISNAGTEGYSRQRVDLLANNGPIEPALYSRTDGIGQGVTIAGIERSFDAFLTERANVERSAEGATAKTDSVLANIEQLFPEPGDNGIQKLLTNFWNSWQNLGDNPGDSSSRTQVLESAAALTQALSTAATGLTTLADASAEELRNVVTQVNSTTQAIAQLNAQIQSATTARIDTQDLLDRRDLLVQQLSGMVALSTRTLPDGTMDVTAGGRTLVHSDSTEPMTVIGGSAGVQVQWASDGQTARLTGGSVGGLLDAVNSMVPRYASMLDGIATNLRDAVNGITTATNGTLAVGAQDRTAAGPLSFTVSLAGATPTTVVVNGADWSGAGGAAALQSSLQGALDTATGVPGGIVATVGGGNGSALTVQLAPANSSSTLTVGRVAGNAGLGTFLSGALVGTDGTGGRAFFTGTGARDLAVAITDPAQVAVAAASGGALDGSGGARLALAGSAPGGPDGVYRRFVVGMGVEKQASATRLANESASLEQADQSRTAQSGVNLDEEMTNMIMYQQAYSAAARFVTAVDEMLTTLIERTGTVGR